VIAAVVASLASLEAVLLSIGLVLAIVAQWAGRARTSG